MRGGDYACLSTWRRYEPYLPPELRQVVEPRETWWEWRDLQVHVDRYEVAEPHGTVLLVHGVGGYGRLVGGFGAPAVRGGFDVLAPDLPGYGLTHAPWGSLTFDLWVDCVRDLAESELARTGRPVILYGVSLGGVAAYHAAAAGAPVAGLICTMLVDTADPAVMAALSRWSSVARLGLPVMHRFPAVFDPLPLPARLATKMQAISNNHDLARLCGSDPLGGRVTLPLRFWRTLTAPSPSLAPERFMACPVLVAHGDADRMTDIDLTQRFVSRLRAPARMVRLDGAGHFPVEQPAASQLADEVAAFLGRVASLV